MSIPSTTTPAISWAFSQRLGSNAKLVLLKLALEAGDSDRCVLAVGEIAEAVGVTSLNVRRILKSLQLAGLVRVEQISRTESAYYLSLS
jgi:DNA-binding MarR family transcriptional regulator